MRDSRCMPPAPAASPTLGSGRANVALSEAMMMSQASAISKPPPMATPFTAAITGLSRSKRLASPPKPLGGWTGRLPVLLLDLGVVLEVVAGAERLVAGAGDDGDPQLGIGLELVEGLGQFLVRHGMAGVVDLRPVDRDDHQAAVGFDLAVLTHGVPLFLGWRAAVYRRYRHTKEPNGGHWTTAEGEEQQFRESNPRMSVSLPTTGCQSLRVAFAVVTSLALLAGQAVAADAKRAVNLTVQPSARPIASAPSGASSG